MTTHQIPVTATCKECGAGVPLSNSMTDDQIVSCPQCGIDVGRFGAIRKAAVEAVRKAALASARKAFKGIKRR